jgi:hypothetical protein
LPIYILLPLGLVMGVLGSIAAVHDEQVRQKNQELIASAMPQAWIEEAADEVEEERAYLARKRAAQQQQILAERNKAACDDLIEGLTTRTAHCMAEAQAWGYKLDEHCGQITRQTLYWRQHAADGGSCL